MKLTIGGYSLTLQNPAQYPHRQDHEMIQVKETSATGTAHIEEFNILKSTYVYFFEDMPDDDYLDLLDFFISNARGQVNEFTLEDDIGFAKLVRFTQPRLNFTTNHYNLWTGSFEVEEVGIAF